MGRRAGGLGWWGSHLPFPSCLLGSKTRKIPYPTKNPFTWLFLLVSCPNYTYEVRDCLVPSPFAWGFRLNVERQSLVWGCLVQQLLLQFELGAPGGRDSGL